MKQLSHYATDWLDKRARLTPDRVALIDYASGEETTYSQWNERANRTANFLRSLGVGKGDRVAVYSSNCSEFPFGLGWQPVGHSFLVRQPPAKCDSKWQTGDTASPGCKPEGSATAGPSVTAVCVLGGGDLLKKQKIFFFWLEFSFCGTKVRSILFSELIF